MTSVFLSYAHSDRDLARALSEGLTSTGYRVWFDEGDLRVGDSLIQTISEALERVDFVVALVSEASVGSSWCNKEVSLAMTSEVLRRETLVLPLRVGAVRMPASLADKLYLEIDPDDPTIGVDRLRSSIEKHLTPRRELPPRRQRGQTKAMAEASPGAESPSIAFAKSGLAALPAIPNASLSVLKNKADSFVERIAACEADSDPYLSMVNDLETMGDNEIRRAHESLLGTTRRHEEDEQLLPDSMVTRTLEVAESIRRLRGRRRVWLRPARPLPGAADTTVITVDERVTSLDHDLSRTLVRLGLEMNRQTEQLGRLAQYIYIVEQLHLRVSDEAELHDLLGTIERKHAALTSTARACQVVREYHRDSDTQIRSVRRSIQSVRQGLPLLLEASRLGDPMSLEDGISTTLHQLDKVTSGLQRVQALRRDLVRELSAIRTHWAI